MERASCGTVHPDQINWQDGRFSIRSYVSSPTLEKSLGRAGLLTPPWLWEAGQDGYTIVDGFKRLAWARDAGVSPIRCVVFPQDADPARLMLLRLETRLCGPALNTAEKAQVVAALTQCAATADIVQEYLTFLQLPARMDIIDPWRRLAGSSETLLRCAASGTVCERAALELAAWEAEARDHAIEILQHLRCSASIQMEILERTSEIALREGKSRLNVLTDPLVTTSLQGRESNHREKTQAVRSALTRMRFPRLAAREARFHEKLARAGLPGNVQLLPPAAFEGDGWRLNLSFSSPQELRQLLSRIRSFVSSPLLEEILEHKGANP